MATEEFKNGREIPHAESILLAGMVNYQPGAVVSRALIQRAAATLTLFAFDEGQGLS